MSTISTHVLDLSRGHPAAGIAVALERLDGAETWTEVGMRTTNADGRVASFGSTTAAGIYRLRFATGAYFDAHQVQAFYPEVHVLFRVDEAGQHFHVPVLLSPFGYSTYRGS